MASVLAFLLSACAKEEQILVEPVTVAKIPDRLKAPLKEPQCDLQGEVADYPSEDVGASLNCWKVAYHSVAAKYNGLRRAVIVREKAMDAAKAAAKR